MTPSTRRLTAFAAAFAVTMLAGCDSSPDDAPLEANFSEVSEPEEVTVNEISAPIPLPPTDDNAMAPIPAAPEEAIEPDAQMLDDADAVGMTARVQRGEPVDEASAPEGNRVE